MSKWTKEYTGMYSREYKGRRLECTYRDVRNHTQCEAIAILRGKDLSAKHIKVLSDSVAKQSWVALKKQADEWVETLDIK